MRKRGIRTALAASATSTSTTRSSPAATAARSSSTASRRAATSPRSRSSRPSPAAGYGFDEESKAMLGGLHLGRRPSSGPLRDRRRLRRPLAVHQRHAERPHRAHRPEGLQDQADLRADPQHLREPRLLLPRPRTPSTCSRRPACRCRCPIGPTPTSTEYATKFKRRHRRHQGRPEDGKMSLGFEILMPPFDYDLGDAGKGPSEGWPVLHLLQLERELIEQARGEGLPEARWTSSAVDWRDGRRRPSTRARSDMIGGAPVLDPAKVAGHRLPLPAGQVARTAWTSTPSGEWIIGSGKLLADVDRLQHRQDPEGHRGQGLRGDDRRHPGADLRRGARGRDAGRPGAAAHPVRRQGLRLHLAVRRERSRQVEAPALRGAPTEQYVVDKIPVAY